MMSDGYNRAMGPEPDHKRPKNRFIRWLCNKFLPEEHQLIDKTRETDIKDETKHATAKLYQAVKRIEEGIDGTITSFNVEMDRWKAEVGLEIDNGERTHSFEFTGTNLQALEVIEEINMDAEDVDESKPLDKPVDREESPVDIESPIGDSVKNKILDHSNGRERR